MVVKRRAWAMAALAFTLVSSHAHAGSEQSYLYDALGRVILSSSSNGSQNGYAYDSAGNRTVVNKAIWSTPTAPDSLQPGQALVVNTQLTSGNGRYVLALQRDGNLVIYGQSGALWSASTWSHPSAVLVMQGDGNLVIYGPVSEVIWTSGTYGHPGAALYMQGDGNLVIYDQSGPIWTSGTACGSC